MATKEKDLVHQNAIQVEMIRKEQRQQRLHTEFSINPHRKLHILPDKPMCRKPQEVIPENSDFIEAFHKARQEPTKKYPMPMTESQEIGWVSTALIQTNRNDNRLNFFRHSSDITKHQESILRTSK
ncbi:protein FAM183A [Corythoichthys intestinalis]|uniref:protein FAM183A n=1 Tax=Corythoichthys intestinalis TaxID=161448 RepID=UPI0025A5DEF8|nr:protein FAM183A [Corythoichthys intestinalis]XP_057696091.1 protein FAM183A [Corythoichthys intestinalis]XP_061790216.1 protein FAM183BP-like [Nerophis lumbriciformis]